MSKGKYVMSSSQEVTKLCPETRSHPYIGVLKLYPETGSHKMISRNKIYLPIYLFATFYIKLVGWVGVRIRAEGGGVVDDWISNEHGSSSNILLLFLKS